MKNIVFVFIFKQWGWGWERCVFRWPLILLLYFMSLRARLLVHCFHEFAVFTKFHDDRLSSVTIKLTFDIIVWISNGVAQIYSHWMCKKLLSRRFDTFHLIINCDKCMYLSPHVKNIHVVPACIYKDYY